MIPSVLAAQLQKGIEDFLRSTYPITTPAMEDVLDELFRPGNLFKGPYLSIDLPFQTANSKKQFFESISLEFSPYVHQEIAFERLIDEQPLSTLVATGTGSGKTECFLYPLLEYCFQHKEEQGIKAIIIYPMNALATDQAKRIAKTISSSAALQGKIRAGLFVGELEKEPHVVMDCDMIITDKSTLRQSPPDILLTNYKMLDYMLLRPGDVDLWKFNKPDTLKFLIVDELHTFDGAQGTDLACLIRRLKKRLRTPEKHLCCVGTSATLGGEGNANDLIEFAEAIFGVPFEKNSVIKEFRQSIQEYFEKNPAASEFDETEVPLLTQLNRLDHTRYSVYGDYLRGVYEAWFKLAPPQEIDTLDWRVELGKRLTQHPAFRILLQLLAGRPVSYVRLNEEFAQRLGIVDSNYYYASLLLDSMVALVSYARRGQKTPFLNVRLQLWLRELKRMVAVVGKTPKLRFSDDLTAIQRKNHLALIYCDDCGATGWAGLIFPERQTFLTDLRTFYSAFFSDDRNVRFLYPLTDEEGQREKSNEKVLVCCECLRINYLTPNRDTSTCQACGSEDLVSALLPNIEVRGRGAVEIKRDCPICATTRQVRLVGAQAANLSGVIVSNLFTSPWNQDKRLIAFSDSVQDASHKAGFIRDRSSHITLRTAVQKFIEEQKRQIPFASLGDEFLGELFRQEGVTQAIGKFLPADLEWHEDFELLKEGKELPGDSRLIDAFKLRIHWDLFMEYGIRARIGRTLEKSGASVAQIEPEALSRAVNDLYEAYINEDGNFRNITKEEIAGFVTGLLMHLKLSGGILQGFLDTFVQRFGNPFAMGSRWIWEKSKIRTLPPAYFTDGRTDKSSFEQIIGPTRLKTWTQLWLQNCFSAIGATLVTNPDRLYELALRSLLKYGVLQEVLVGQSRVWGLNAEKLLVTTDVKKARCSSCKHELSVGADEAELWISTRCLRKSCLGKYVIRESEINDYYRGLFSRGDVWKIVPAEHTGLLERDTREAIENSFINHVYPWDPNVLSATSTLEMGIDIGDLSAVLLCSVPPSQANYLQRIGRAGRRDGNSLAVTVANGKPHDLFFFSAPEEMIAGAVRSPGVFLDASAILERQLTAFCFDQWVATGVSDSEFPNKLESVLNNIDKKNAGAFPYNWIRFVQDNRQQLLSSFLALFQKSVSEDTAAQLTSFFEQDKNVEGSLEWRVINGLEELAKERSSTKGKLRTLDKKIREKKDDPVRDETYELELDELRNEKSGLQEIVSRINKKPTLEFFTDEGFIPNYAFPEAGVTLRSVIYRKKERKRSENDDKQFQHWTYSYERPSSSAISELAPANFFYAEGRKVKIDQINMAVSEVENWRLCPNCSYCKRILGDDSEVSCPTCEDGMWPDVKQRKQMIRLRQVIATTSAAASSIGDEKEERSPAYFNKQLLVNFDGRFLKDAFSIDDDNFPFGFEYSSKTTFREINSGQKEAVGDQITIAGVQSVRKGFQVCKECGKVQERNSNQQVHSFTCTARNKDSDKNLIELLYLYREFSSEAIRILLPATSFGDTDQLVHSFIAAFQMGIREFFGGKVDHLNTTIYEEPIAGTSMRKKYVVIYDKVPGGTGYLKLLMKSEDKMMDLLDLSLAKLNTCSCNQIDLTPGSRPKDGCYRCLFAYRNSYDMPTTSREKAKSVLNDIISRKHLLKRVDTLSKVQVSALLDSELELRFLQALGEVKLADAVVSLNQEVVNGKPGYILRLGDKSYDIEPQVSLGPAQGVAVESRADFVFYPRRSTNNTKPIVVFVDGFEYHRNRIELDLLQRAAIARSGNYNVWSIAWDDVDARFSGKTDFFFDFLSLGSNDNVISKRKTFSGHFGIAEFIDFYRHESFRLLVEYLRNPQVAKWRTHALLIAMGFFSEPTADGVKAWQTAHNSSVPAAVRDAFDNTATGLVFGRATHVKNGGPGTCDIFVSAPQSALTNKSVEGAYVATVFDRSESRPESELRKEWVGLLRLYNLLHFLPNCFFMTKQEIETGNFKFVPLGSGWGLDTPQQAAELGEWQESFNFAAREVHHLLSVAQANGWEPPEVGADIVGLDGANIATAELVWFERKIAVFLEPLTPIADRGLKATGWKFGDVSLVEKEIERGESK
jgi:DEAD/DEAH box helicase domain-containing protein